jgi:hypothetical protein
MDGNPRRQSVILLKVKVFSAKILTSKRKWGDNWQNN